MVLMGGGLGGPPDPQQRQWAVHRALVEAAAARVPGRPPQVGVLTTGAQDPEAQFGLYASVLMAAGAQVRHLPGVADWLAQAPSLQVLYLAGGDQALHREAFAPGLPADQPTPPTPVLHALRQAVAERSLILAGSSAGTAVLAGGVCQGRRVPMVAGGSSMQVLAHGYHLPQAQGAVPGGVWYTGGGLGLFSHGVLDQHCAQRERQGRLWRAVVEAGLPAGFGVDEHTALWVYPTRADGCTPMAVVGSGAVWVVARHASAVQPPVQLYPVRAGERLWVDAHGQPQVPDTRAWPVPRAWFN